MWNRSKRIVSRKRKGLYTVIVSIAVLLLIILSIMFRSISEKRQEQRAIEEAQALMPAGIQDNFLEPNEFSRPGTALGEVHGVVIHYTANPGTGAEANRNYFNNLPKINKKKESKTYASSHFVIGIEGEIVQCIPLTEIAYASNDRNIDTISIECCHKRKSGKFTDATYLSLVQLTAYLCKKYQLTEKNVIRHYDVTEKICPKYFVDHEDAWQQFLADVAAKLT